VVGASRGRVLGLAIGVSTVHAVLIERDTIAWAGKAEYSGLPELSEAVARLAGEAGRPVRRARAVLERRTVQLRSLVPAPPLKQRAVRSYVALEAPRLFRGQGVPLVTDGSLVTVDKDTRALWAAAASEPLLRAVLDGCTQAGLALESLGPAAELLPNALADPRAVAVVAFPNSTTSEVLSVGEGGPWRSRLVNGAGEEPSWVAALASLGGDARYFAPAYAAAVATPRLQLIPADARAARERAANRRLRRVAAVGLGVWLLAAGVHETRLFGLLQGSTRYLESVAPALDSALAARRDLDAGRATLATIAEATQRRSRRLALLSGLTAALGDSVFLVTLRVEADGMVRVAGYAPSAPRVLAQLERIDGLRGAQLEGPVTRETVPSGATLDRFAIAARLEERP
jgi:hypothetical protein